IPFLLSSCRILAMKYTGEPMPWAISRTPTRRPSFDSRAMKITALIAYSQVLENIHVCLWYKSNVILIKDKKLFYFFDSPSGLKTGVYYLFGRILHQWRYFVVITPQR